MIFDGKKIRDRMIKELADQVALKKKRPVLAEFLIGDDPVSAHYAKLKEKMAAKAGVLFCLYKSEPLDTDDNIVEAIKFLNADEGTSGIMIQMPVPKGFDQRKLIEAISPEKDVDGLRYCLGLDSDYIPPVVLAIDQAIKNSEFRIQNTAQKIVIIGAGFLVGAPLKRFLKEKYETSPLVILSGTKNLKENERSFAPADGGTQDDIKNAGVIISATGKAGLIKPEMVKEGVILIDAGTAESNGELLGDIDPACYKKASFYTPVPGGIGPVTVAMLLKNVVEK